MKKWLLLAAILCLLPRGIDLVSDPPANLGSSGGYYADEGFWTHNARNKILFGSWTLDEWNNMYMSPLTHWLTYISFRFFGVGLRQARIVPVFLSILAVLMLMRGLPRDSAVIGTILFSCNVFLIHFGRLSLLETPIIFLLLLSWFFLSRDDPTRIDLFFSGMVMGLALATKLTVIYFVPAVFLSILFLPGKTIGRYKGCIFIIFGLCVAVLIWLLTVGSHMHLFLQYVRFYSAQQKPWLTKLVQNIHRPDFLDRFRSMPILVFGGMLVAAGILNQIRKLEVPRSVLLATFWLVIGSIYLNTLSYNPLRYYMPLVPPLIILTAWAGAEAWKGKLRLPPGLPGIVYLVFFLWGFKWKYIYYLIPEIQNWPLTGKIASALISGLLLLGIWIAAGKLFRYQIITRIVLGLLFFTYLCNHDYEYAQWFKYRTQEIYQTSKYLGKRFNNATFTGQWAPILCMENKHRAVPVWPRFVNGDAPFKKYRITHGVIWLRHLKNFLQWYPKDFARAKILETLWIKETQVILCAFNQKKPVLQEQ